MTNPNIIVEEVDAFDPLDSIVDEILGETEPVKAKPEPEEPPAEEETEEIEAQEADEEPEFIELKHNGKPVKLKLEDVIEQAQKGFDYTQKTQEIAEQRKQVEQYAQFIQQQAQQQPPIAEQIMAEASRGGVDQLPSNLPITDDEEDYANGGIVAFKDGERVQDPDTRSPTDRGLDELIARINRSANNNIIIPPAANTGIAGTTPEVFSVDGVSPEFGGSTISADQDTARVAKIQAERAAAEDAQRQRFLRTAAPQLAAPETSETPVAETIGPQGLRPIPFTPAKAASDTGAGRATT